MHARASSKGQIVIPAPLRRKYGIQKGTRVNISEEDGRIFLQPVTVDLIRERINKLRGKFRGAGLLQALMEERERDRRREDGDWTPPGV